MRKYLSPARHFTATGLVIATALTGSIAPLVQAQQAAPGAALAPPEEPSTGDAVVITGSNIKRTDYEGPQSIVVFDAARIARTGATNVSDLIKKLPQNTGGFSNAVNTGLSFSPGAAAASLRGLGESSTLLLINGRRVSPFPLPQNGTDSFYDLNSIPIDAIDRVEILKESASAVYGSDAIAGVINVILKTNYTGFQMETYYGDTTDKNASEFRESFLSGFSNEKFRIQVSGSYLHQNSLAARDRGFSRTADHRKQGGTDLRSVRSNPATIFTSTDVLAVPRGSNGNLAVGDFLPGILPDGNFRNRFDFNKFTELIPETDRKSAFTTFGYNLSPHVELFGEVFYSSVKTREVVAPTPPDSAGDGFVVPASNPFNPFGEDVQFLYRAVEAGPRRSVTDLDNYRYLGGLKFKDLPNNWTAEAAFLYSEANLVSYNNGGYLSVDKVNRALNQTDPNKALNIFGDGLGVNRRSVIDGLVIRPRNDGIAYIYSTDIKASGELFQLPAGPVGLAVGAEYREEALTQGNSFPAGTVVGQGGSNSSGDRDVRSAFYELAIPITEQEVEYPRRPSVEFSIAQRLDDYSDFGDTTKPKFGFKLKPFDGVLFRGAYSEGFRAPSLPQLFLGEVNAFDTVTNPRTGITTDVPITTGGNRNLKPETSYSYFIGTVIEPPFVPGLTIQVDFFRIEQRNIIDQPSAQFIVDNLINQVTFDNAEITLPTSRRRSRTWVSW